MTHNRYPWLAALMLLLLLGCSHQRYPVAIDRTPLMAIGKIDDAGLFSADFAGNNLALERNGLVLSDRFEGTERILSPERPEVLSWSRDGQRLSAGFRQSENRCYVITYSPQGKVLDEVSLPVNLLSLTWTSRGELLAVGYQLKVYSFGANLALKLYRLDAADDTPVNLGDVTIKPATVRRLADRLPTLLQVAFSPMGDELVYTRLHDPPEFPPYLQLIHRNWQETDEREQVRLPVERVQINWDSQGDYVVVSGLDDPEQLIRLWPGRPDEAIQSNGVAGIVSSTGRYRFVDGRLFDRDGLLSDWGRGARLQFLTKGQYLLAVDRSLYLGAGLASEQPIEHDEKRWSLRRWRYQGLITPVEYQRLSQGE